MWLIETGATAPTHGSLMSRNHTQQVKLTPDMFVFVYEFSESTFVLEVLSACDLRSGTDGCNRTS